MELLVGVHVCQDWQLFQASQQDGCPRLKVIKALAAQRVLILRIGLTPAHLQLLRGLQEQIGTGYVRHLRTKPRNHLVSRDVRIWRAAFAKRLKHHKHAPGVRSLRAVYHVIHGGISLYDPRESEQLLA